MKSWRNVYDARSRRTNVWCTHSHQIAASQVENCRWIEKETKIEREGDFEDERFLIERKLGSVTTFTRACCELLSYCYAGSPEEWESKSARMSKREKKLMKLSWRIHYYFVIIAFELVRSGMHACTPAASDQSRMFECVLIFFRNEREEKKSHVIFRKLSFSIKTCNVCLAFKWCSMILLPNFQMHNMYAYTIAYAVCCMLYSWCH